MSVYDEYAKQLDEEALRQHESIDKSTKAQLDALAENKKLVEAEKQNAFRGAYVDYAKNINPYGVQSELAYGSGLGGAGKGETAQANFYNTYQNRLGEIDTATTGQLRDIAQQESAARLAGDQAKLDVTSQANQLKAAAQREDALRAEQYAREDKANAYNQLLTAITGTGYTPTDAELAAAGMTRELANSYRTAYQQSLYSASKAKTVDPVEFSDAEIEKLNALADSGSWKEYLTEVDALVEKHGGNLADGYLGYYINQAPDWARRKYVEGGWDEDVKTVRGRRSGGRLANMG